MIVNSLIIPCYNEEGNIDNLVRGCSNFLLFDENELILVNNGSIDNTKSKIEYHTAKNKKIKIVNILKNKGFGDGVIKGIKASNGKIIIYTHADSETDPDDVIHGLKIAKKLKRKLFFIKGNRIDRRKNNWTYFEMVISSGLSVICSIFFGKKLFDLHAQPVIFNKDLTKYFDLGPKDFMFDIYVYLLALKYDYSVIRFPVNFNKSKRIYGKGSSDSINKKIIGIINHLSEMNNLKKNKYLK